MDKKDSEPDDRWIPTICSMCYGTCSILAHRVNGVIVKLEGNPESPVGSGRMCAKGASGLMTFYDPNRARVPLRRTNPNKGIGVDPQWKQITWEEALAEITDRLDKLRQDDPRKLVVQGTTTVTNTSRRLGAAFVNAFGSWNQWVAGGGLHCGNGAHLIAGMMHASWSIVPDYRYCDYALYFGASKGHSAGHVANAVAQQASDARARGMRLVVVDPMLGSAAAKASEWVPIRVGTDGALALAMLNVLLNELSIFDAPYLKRHTNGPYLVGPDNLHVRDKATGKPLIWDPIDNAAKTFDDPSVRDFALEGAYTVEGQECAPAFQLLRSHVRKYTPEMAEGITTIPASTIRRLAREFGEAARIGSTIVLDGVELPYRPVSAIFFRGAEGHASCTWTCIAIELLNQVVGAADVPGGTLGFNPVSHGHPETGRPHFVPRPCPDGLMITGDWISAHQPYPVHEPVAPQSIGLLELFPLAMFSPVMACNNQEEVWERFKLPYRPEILINYGSNSVMSVGNASTVAESLRRYSFIVSFDIFLNEFTDFADIVLPDVCYLERYDPNPNPMIFSHPPGLGEWAWTFGQPVVSAPDDGSAARDCEAQDRHERRAFNDVMIELASRLGILDETYAVLNLLLKLQAPYRLRPGDRCDWGEIADRLLKGNFGEERGLEWFRRHGVLKWPKRVQEVYWRPFVPVRVPIYYEGFERLGRQVQRVVEEIDVPVDYSHYHALPEWSGCPSHRENTPGFDLFGFYYRDVLHTNSLTMENPWLDEVAQQNPYSYAILLNAETGARKGIRDGDLIWVESAKGRRIKGRVKLTQGMHPEGLAVAGCAGHWSPNQPVARGKGVFFNDLLEIDLEHADPINLNLDLCVKVKISKAIP